MTVCFRSMLLITLIVMTASQLPAQQAAQPGAGPENARFDQVIGRMEALQSEFDALIKKYQAADAPAKATISQQINTLQQKGLDMQKELFEAAEKAYLEAPGANKKVNEVLPSIVAAHLQSDDYEPALRLAEAMIKNNFPEKGINNLAGVAAFSMDQFDKAATYFEQAKANDALDQTGSRYASQIADYKKYWAKEQQIRAAEAKVDNLPRVLMKTNKGDMVIELYENEAPNTVANFVSLVEKGYYNGLTFHRVLPGFMAQGGCPDGTGSGGPGYEIPCECHQPNFRRHFRGTLSMAHAGRDTGGSQFFLTFLPTGNLDATHTVFGRVIQGTDVLAKLQRRDPNDPRKPKPDTIVEAKVLRKRDHPYVPKKTK